MAQSLIQPAFAGHLSLFTFQMRCDASLNSSLMMADEKFHHSVYVILLDPVTLGLPSIVRFNPNRDPAKPCAYVGMTGLPVEQRFEIHKKGVKAAWVVKKYSLSDCYNQRFQAGFFSELQRIKSLIYQRRWARIVQTGLQRYKLLFIPGFHYLSDNTSGADFSNQRQLMHQLGLDVQLAATEEDGTVEENATIIARIVRDLILTPSSSGYRLPSGMHQTRQGCLDRMHIGSVA